MKTNMILLLQIAGVLHLGLLCATALMPRAVSLRSHISPLPPFIRRAFWVYYTFIALCLAGFGIFTVVFANTLASGSAMATALCAFFTVFWLLRLIVATFVYDVRPYLTNAFWKLGYHATNVVYIYLLMIYTWAALKGGAA